MVVWLEQVSAEAVLGADLASDLDDAFAVHVASVKSYIEDRRPDLGKPGSFTPPEHVETAAAMLAYRCYLSRTTPGTELGNDETLARMLGIGKHRRFRFGGAA